MRKTVILFLVSVFICAAFAAEFNQFRPEGEVSNNEVTFWGEVISEEPGELNLYVNNEIVHTSQHNGGRSDFPAGYKRQLSDGNYSWFIEFQGEKNERSTRTNFTIISPAFVDFEHRNNRTFDLGASSGQLTLFINDTEVVNRNLSSSYTDTLNLSLAGGRYTYYATLDTGNEVLETDQRSINISFGDSEGVKDLDQVEPYFEESIRDSLNKSGDELPDQSSSGSENTIYSIIALSMVLIVLILLFWRLKKVKINLRQIIPQK